MNPANERAHTIAAPMLQAPNNDFVTIRLPMEPRGKGRPRGIVRNVRAGETSSLSCRGRAVRIGAKPDEKSAAWEKEAQVYLSIIKGKRCPILEKTATGAPTWISMVLQYPRPKSVPKRIVYARSKKIDNDNAEKLVWDSMNGILLLDDHQIVWNHAVKIWTDGDPEILVRIGYFQE